MDSKNFPPTLAQHCLRYTRLLLLAIGFFLFSSQDAQASHMAGADISYECVGPNQYRITVTLYRDCESFLGLPGPSIPVNYSSLSCGLSGSQQLTQGTITEVSQLCPAALPGSSCNGGSLYPGMQASSYTGIITFPQACTDWRVSWSECCRNAAITNLLNPDNFSLYVEAMINTTICNSSPVFTSRPTPYFCAGQCYQYNHGAYDPDNDTLRYALTCPLTAANTCIANSIGYSVAQPLSTNPAGSFTFNQFTGQMGFCTTPGMNQQAVAAVTVYQIKNGDTIGYVQRDIQMIVITTPNCTAPVAPQGNPIVYQGGSFDTISNSFVVCAGETLIFDLVLFDPDGDSITIDAVNTNLNLAFGAGNWSLFLNNNAPPFRKDSAQFYFSIVTSAANLGSTNFTIGVTDNACPIPGSQILGFNLIVPGVNVTAPDTVVCPGISQQLQLSANSFTTTGGSLNGAFAWTQVSGPPVAFSDTSIYNPFITTPGNTVDGDSVVLEVTFSTTPDPVTGAICVTTDNITIRFRTLPLALLIFATDTTLCPNNLNDTINLSAAIFGPGIDLINGIYAWTANPGGSLTNLSSTTINNPTAILAGGYGDSITYTLTYTYGLCVGTDDVKLKFNEGFLFTQGDTTVCTGDTVQIRGIYSSLGLSSGGGCGLRPGAACNGPETQPIVGTNTTTFTYPFQGLWEDARTQILYRASELTAAGVTPGLIKELAFNVTTKVSSLPYTGFTIKMGCTSLNQFVSSPVQPFVGGMAQVYTNTINTATGWNNFVFQTPYEWDGVSNLIIEVCFNNNAWTSNDPVQAGTTTFPSVLTFNNDGAVGCTAAVEVGGTVRPRIRFTTCALPAPVKYTWTPPVGFLNNSDTLAVGTVQVQGSYVYQVTANDGECVLWDSVVVSVVTAIPSPIITQGIPANQATSVLFNWGASPGATSWEYSLDGGVTWIPRALQDSSLLVSGLTMGDCVDLLVRAVGGVGPCPTNAATYLNGCTTSCPMPNNSIITNLSCNAANDGMVQIAISGGVLGYHPDFTATLFDGAGTQIGATVNTLDTATFTGLVAGTYYTYLTDTLGCFVTSTTVVVTEPAVLNLSAVGTTTTNCLTSADGTASVMGTGGTTTYNWLWDANAGNQTTPTATGLMAGSYDVTLTDANGCEDVLNMVIYSPFSAAPAIVLNSTSSTTCGGSGSATLFSTINMVGNANAYTYQWSNSTATGPSATGLAAGVTTLTVTDVNGCVAMASVTITGSPGLTITGMPSTSPGCGVMDGQITVAVVGDAAGYTYQWSANAMGQTTALVTGLGVGNYSVTVTGLSNGCTVTGSTSLSNVSALSVVGFNVTNPSCGISSGTADVVTLGATSSLTYLWSDNQMTNPATGLGAGTYGVTVTDPATGCSSVGDTVIVQDALTAGVGTFNNPACNLSNGSISVNASTAFGASGISYNWSTGATTASVFGLGAGTYDCTVTYQNCTVTIPSVTLTNDALTISVDAYNGFVCNGDLAGYINLNVVPATASPTFLWSNGATTQNISGLGAGAYSVTATLGSCVQSIPPVTITNTTLTLNATAGIFGNNSDTIPLGSTTQILSGMGTNFLNNPTYAWTTDGANVVTIQNAGATGTFVTGILEGQTWLYFTATAGPCVNVIDSVLIVVDDLDIEIIDKDTVNCNGVATSYANVTIMQGANVTFLWSNGATTQNISGLAAGVYTVTATSGSSTDIASVTITDVTLAIDPWVTTVANKNTVIEVGTVVNINGGVTTNNTPTYNWTASDYGIVNIVDSTLAATTASGTTIGATTLYFTANVGSCMVTDTIHIRVEQYMGMPNAFSPDGDGINDFYRPTGISSAAKVSKFEIYNRWGQLLYSDATIHSWDGTYMGVAQPQDHYVYVFEYEADNGTIILVRGEFYLIR